MSRSRSYDQFCGLARALDVIGDRWALLIVRELLIGPRRYSDLKAALPGAASNLLAQRLRDLRDAGVVSTRTIEAPTPAALYELTPLGTDLDAAVLALTRWGGHRMIAGRGADSFHPRWLVIAFRALLVARDPRLSIRLRFIVEGVPILIDAHGGTLATTLDSANPVEAEISTDGESALAIASGKVTIAAVQRAGRCRVTGNRRALQRAAQLFRTTRAA